VLMTAAQFIAKNVSLATRRSRGRQPRNTAAPSVRGASGWHLHPEHRRTAPAPEWRRSAPWWRSISPPCLPR